MRKLILLLNLCAILANGDTITYRWGASFNGKVTYKDGKFRVQGRVKGKIWNSDEISPEDVSEVRFNSVEFNSAPPPESVIPLSPTTVECDAILKNGTTVRLVPLLSIDKSIRSGKAKPLEKKDVLLIRIIRE